MSFKWNRKSEIKEGALGYTIFQEPAKKEFETMFEILKDAEKYDFKEEISTRDCLLKQLSIEIDKFIK